MAEVDILACKDGVCDIYEVKCSYRICKAKKQIRRIRKSEELTIGKAFFFCGESDILVAL